MSITNNDLKINNDLKLKTKINLEKRYKNWYYLIALYISFFVGNLFETEMTVYTLIGQLNMLFSSINGFVPYAVVVFLNVIIPLFHVLLFHVFARVFYGLSNAFSFGAISMQSKDFVSALRLFVIFLNLALGFLNLFYYLFNFLIPLGMLVLNFAFTTTAYLLFFMYIYKHYLDKKTAHRAFRTMALFYLTFTLFNLAGGILI